jgi:hypothetical protein
VIDNALTRPWTVTKNYQRDLKNIFPEWNEENCPETNNHAAVGKEDYMVSADGLLMPTKKASEAAESEAFQVG